MCNKGVTILNVKTSSYDDVIPWLSVTFSLTMQLIMNQCKTFLCVLGGNQNINLLTLHYFLTHP